MQKGKLAFLFISDCERFPEWLSHKKIGIYINII